MIPHKNASISILVSLLLVVASSAAGETVELPDSPILMRAMVDEINRSLGLQMEDLDQPYYIQYTVDDVINYEISAAYGTITSFDRDRSRRFFVHTRVGSFELDNTNFRDTGRFGGFGRFDFASQASLPLDDDYTALRQAMWRSTDRSYKQAVETLTKKRAYLKDKTIEDRPPDFSSASNVEHVDPPARLDFDPEAWKQRLREISGHFRQYPLLQRASAQLLVGAGNTYIVSTEGTRLRFAERGALLIITAEIQAEGGMRIASGLNYFGHGLDGLPALEKVKAEIDELTARLIEASLAPVLESYAGPVLFEGLAAAQMFRRLLAKGVAGNPDPIGGGRRMAPGPDKLERKLGQRILPRSFRVYDDSTVKRVGQTALLGHYLFDAEGVPATRVDIVREGKLEDLVMSRVPTKKRVSTNGHARRAARSGNWQAAIGCMFVEDEEGLPEDQLKAALLEAAQEEGLEYGIRVASLGVPGLGSSRSAMMSFFRVAQRGGSQGLDDPVFVYKVYVADGREELVRGCEFGQVRLRDLKDILAAGAEPAIYNFMGIGFGGRTAASTIISPAVLFEELDLSKIEEEQDKPPILDSPLAR